MQTNSKLIRQSMGCGFEKSAPPAVAVLIPEPQGRGGDLGFKGEITVCPGYSTRLHEVREVDHIRPHWKVGSVVAACGGEQPSEQTLIALEIIDGQYNAAENYWTTPVKDGGGR